MRMPSAAHDRVAWGLIVYPASERRTPFYHNGLYFKEMIDYFLIHNKAKQENVKVICGVQENFGTGSIG